MRAEIPTSHPGLVLRVLEVPDAQALFELLDENRDHLSQLGDDTAGKYPTYESVVNSIVANAQPQRRRYGIWKDDVFVGTINLTLEPLHERGWIGYWIGRQFAGQGYASIATDALCAYAVKQLGVRKFSAHTHVKNTASQRTLVRSNFAHVARSHDFLVFSRSL